MQFSDIRTNQPVVQCSNVSCFHYFGGILQSHMGEMFAFHSSTMANTLDTPIMVFTRTGSMAVILSHYRPYSTIFAFTNK